MRKFLLNIYLFLLVALLSACGFTPVYKKTAPIETGDQAKEELYTIKVDNIGSSPTLKHSAQELKAKLEDSFNPQSVNAEKKYRLTLSLDKVKGSQAIRRTGEITRYTITMTAYYKLIDLKTGETILDNTSRMRGSFDAVGSDFGTFTAEEDTVGRATREIANDIAMHIAAFFHDLEKSKKNLKEKGNNTVTSSSAEPTSGPSKEPLKIEFDENFPR